MNDIATLDYDSGRPMLYNLSNRTTSSFKNTESQFIPAGFSSRIYAISGGRWTVIAIYLMGDTLKLDVMGQSLDLRCYHIEITKKSILLYNMITIQGDADVVRFSYLKIPHIYSDEGDILDYIIRIKGSHKIDQAISYWKNIQRGCPPLIAARLSAISSGVKE